MKQYDAIIIGFGKGGKLLSPDPHDLAIKQTIFLRELHTANIALVLHRVIHRSPSCSRI